MSEYTEFMAKKVKPFLKEKIYHGFFQSNDGLKLSYYQAVHPEERAAIVIAHGFCEFFGKYHELMYRFYEEGYSVFFLEFRGYGKSERSRKLEGERVFVESFDEYVSDLETFIEKIVMPAKKSDRIFLYAHSMGGCVGALLLEKRQDLFQCAVLSSPMLQMNYGKIPDWTVGALAVYSKASGNDEDYAPGQHAWEGKYEFENSSCVSKERYDYQFALRNEDSDYQTWGGTWAWARAARNASEKAIRNAHLCTTPVLLFRAGKDAMVKAEGQLKFAEKSKNTTVVVFENAKHELFNQEGKDLKEYYKDIFVFFNAYVRH